MSGENNSGTVGELTSSVGTVPTNPPAAEPIPTGSTVTTPEFSIPEAYRDKAYLKDVKSYDDVFKKLDGAESLIGQRPAGIPHKSASQEEWDKFYKAVGKPETADQYEFKYAEGEKGHEGFEKGIKDIFHKANLTKEQAAIIQQGFDPLIKSLQPSQEQLNAEFEEMSTKMYGDKKDAILGNVEHLIKENLPVGEEYADVVKNISNKELLVMSAVINNIKNKYINEDVINQSGSRGESPEDLQKEAIKLMTSKEWNDPFHPDHNKVKAQVTELYSRRSKVMSAR